ncbi:MAG: TlpA family protein disulfide reductase [Nitrospirota bacterium]|nr:TlpA family protein disulfide reductase [Nitrospirota bacterium]
MKIFNRNFFIGLVAGLILTILILIGGGYVLMRSFTSRTGEKLESILQPPPFPTQTRMDYNWRIQGLDGKELDVGKSKGKVIFLNFWATWCPPCVAEMSSIQRLYDEIKSEGIDFICVSDEKRTKVSKFVKEKGFTFPIYTLVGDQPQVLRTRGIPATFIISQDGQVVFKHVGAAKWDHKTSIDFMKKLM